MNDKIRTLRKQVWILSVLTFAVLSLVFYLTWKSHRIASGTDTPEFRCGVTSPPHYGPIDGGSATFSNKNGIDGKALFKANCSSCHTTTDKKLTGPGFKGVRDKIPGGTWRYQFVRHADSLVKAGDAYAVQISKEYDNRAHPRFPQLTNDQIDAILGY